MCNSQILFINTALNPWISSFSVKLPKAIKDYQAAPVVIFILLQCCQQPSKDSVQHSAGSFLLSIAPSDASLVYSDYYYKQTHQANIWLTAYQNCFASFNLLWQRGQNESTFKLITIADGNAEVWSVSRCISMVFDQSKTSLVSSMLGHWWEATETPHNPHANAVFIHRSRMWRVLIIPSPETRSLGNRRCFFPSSLIWLFSYIFLIYSVLDVLDLSPNCSSDSSPSNPLTFLHSK